MQEEWRSVSGYEGLYEVSNLGRVVRCAGSDSLGRPRHRRPLRGTVTGGYAVVNLCRDARPVVARVHRLVAAAFLPAPPSGAVVVNHIDGVKLNNAHTNLEWVTTQGNDAHAQRMGLKAYGERHPAAKLTWRAVAVIREQRETRTMSNKAIAAKYGVSESTIERVLSRARWNFPSDLPSRP